MRVSLTETDTSSDAPNGAVLIVEDDVEMREALKSQLADLGYGPLNEANSIAQLVEHLQRQKFELVIIDLNLGQQDGVKLISVIRNAPLPHVRSMPILATSTSSSGVRIQSAFGAGADGFLAKPFSALNLRRQIQFAMSKVAVRTQAG